MLSVFVAIASLSVVSNRAALFCSSPLFTQCPYMVNAHVSIIFRMYLFSYGFGCSSLSVIVFGVRRNFCNRRQTHTQSMIACDGTTLRIQCNSGIFGWCKWHLQSSTCTRTLNFLLGENTENSLRERESGWRRDVEKTAKWQQKWWKHRNFDGTSTIYRYDIDSAFWCSN